MENRKPSLAPVNITQYYQDLHAEGQREEALNRGYVWTIRIDGTSSIKAMGLANVDYTLHLNCSHVGETPYGVYRGELALNFQGDISGTKLLLALIGFKSSEDLSGWFRNDRFVMKVKPYSFPDEAEFADLFLGPVVQTEGPTGDAAKDAANQFAAQFTANLTNIIYGNQVQPEKTQPDENAIGLWYDWDFHMTGGDMGTYMKLNGLGPFFIAHGHAETDASGHAVTGDATVTTPFTGAFHERYDEPIDNPFPYTVKLYPDNSVLFTLYNAKGGPLTVRWAGRMDRIPVSQTAVVRP